MTAIQWTDKLTMQRATSVKARNRHVIGSTRLHKAARTVLILAGAFAVVAAIVGVRLHALLPPL